MTGATLSLGVLAGVLIGAAVGYAAIWLFLRRTYEQRLDRAATSMLDRLVAEQIADDRDALTSLPPGVSGSDVWELAGRRGISIREAAAEIFTAQARARLDANLRRHHGRLTERSHL